MRLTKSNFELFAAQHYDNPNCESVDEFKEDLLHFKYLKRLVSQYTSGGKLNDRLIINHIIIIHNLFGIKAGTEMIMHKMKGNESIIKPFLIALNALPERITLDNQTIITSNIPLDIRVVEALRKTLSK